ncbi:hypothetical protein [Kitasatospora sp. NPDC057198]|uniref:hypothetical protein n=1 Tax=Kitasatospora sp. NPDC057198 TaxID=3346046 RepID=UPI0036309601
MARGHRRPGAGPGSRSRRHRWWYLVASVLVTVGTVLVAYRTGPSPHPGPTPPVSPAPAVRVT